MSRAWAKCLVAAGCCERPDIDSVSVSFLRGSNYQGRARAVAGSTRHRLGGMDFSIAAARFGLVVMRHSPKALGPTSRLSAVLGRYALD
jgi:hypothetical protein